MSNQKRVKIATDPKGPKSKGDSKSLTVFKEKATAVMRQLDVPLSVYAATESDEFRKPRMGMWCEFLDDFDFDVDQGDHSLDLSGSMFVGDAAGRQGDFSSSDRSVFVRLRALTLGSK